MHKTLTKVYVVQVCLRMTVYVFVVNTYLQECTYQWMCMCAHMSHTLMGVIVMFDAWHILCWLVLATCTF